MPSFQHPAQRGSAFFYIMVLLGVAVAAFLAGRYSADGALAQENKKLRASVRLLRGDKLGIGVAQETAPDAPGPAVAAPSSAVLADTAPPPTEVAIPTPVEAAPPAPEVPAVVTPPAPEAAATATAPETPIPPPKPRKTAKSWISDLGDGVQGTATYWHCNNAKLVADGMEYYAYGSIPAASLKKPGDAYSVKNGKAIVVSGCWSPKLDKAILYRKSDGRRWEPGFKLDDGSWSLEME
ncbi:hypothetical protein SAMN02949497_0246 [Methylomagnum ishizawai]|uniref:Uncharacterized protein n=1 Tax=Methylomagnum ishizawai TaxID=1760988 RepID=A0A1Y6D4Z9_9GAMM|nr:hypothetical protein SAMN02949497_0246 [Methylomagnum ishizawai]